MHGAKVVSWGHFFFDALLSASRIYEFGSEESSGSTTLPGRELDDSLDRSFQFQMRGLNVDFMSYAMLALANNSKEALLDLEPYQELADKTFGVFFKHFAAENATSAQGNYVYSPVGEDYIPWSLGPVIYNSILMRRSDQGALDTGNRTSATDFEAQATLHVPTEQLVMSPISVIMCFVLLTILIIIITIIYTTDRKLYKMIPRDVDNLASILAFTHGSDKLLAWVRNAPPPKPWYHTLFSRSLQEEGEQVKARLGPFIGADGTERWGIELVDQDENEDERIPMEPTVESIEMEDRLGRGMQAE